MHVLARLVIERVSCKYSLRDAHRIILAFLLIGIDPPIVTICLPKRKAALCLKVAGYNTKKSDTYFQALFNKVSILRVCALTMACIENPTEQQEPAVSGSLHSILCERHRRPCSDTMLTLEL